MQKILLREFCRGSLDFQMIEPGDKILCALSGGRDSWSLLYLLRELQAKVPFSFDLAVIIVNPGFAQFKTADLEQYLRANNYSYHIAQADFTTIMDQHQRKGSACSFCSRLRRGIIYSYAHENGFNKIALGHHRDDFIETFLLNVFYSGQLKSMAPKLFSDDGRNICIRPMIYLKKAEIDKFAEAMRFPILEKSCPYYDEKISQRANMKNVIDFCNGDSEDIRNSIFASLKNIRKSHLLQVDL